MDVFMYPYPPVPVPENMCLNIPIVIMVNGSYMFI